MRHVRGIALIALVLLVGSLPRDALAAAEGAVIHARAVAALDGDTIALDDGRQVRLAGIFAAKPVTAGALVDPPPIVAWTQGLLDALVAEQEVRLEFEGGLIGDRHGRLLAHGFLMGSAAGESPERWLQEALLRQGAARVATTVDTRWRAAEMLAVEAEARAARRGLWALGFYRILTAEDAAGGIGGFRIVEGRVRQVTAVGSNVFLNFGEDWRTDFTVALDARARRLFREAGEDPGSLEGRRLRVRGWLRAYNGPFIGVTHPEEIELLME